MPVDDKCELCYRVWKECFAARDWEQLVSDAKDEKLTVGVMVQEARKNMSGNEFKAGSSVKSHVKVQYEVSKLFLLATEKDLRSLTHQARINRGDVKTLPVLHIPSEKGDGSAEAHYVFRHPWGDLKECKIKMVMEQSMDKELMGPGGKEWFEGQAQETFKSSIGSKESESGLLGLFAKETYLQDFSEWKKRFDKGGESWVPQKGGAEPGDMGTIDVDDDDDDENASEEGLTGVAAGDLRRAASSRSLENLTPAKSKLSRGSSSVASGGKAPPESASVAGSGAVSTSKSSAGQRGMMT